MNNKRTKIVASISDERCEVEFLKQLHEAGMNVVRMNTAHATPEGLKKIIRNVRAVSNQIAILIDTKGPEVRTTACAGGARYLVDAYCGSGLFALTLAPHFERVLGVEVSETSADWARANARSNGIAHAEFLAASAEAIFEKVDFPAEETAVVIDPPRKGCDAAFLSQLFAFGPQRVVYVSCNPATQIRDLAEFDKAGYEVTEVQPFDLFPQTKHLECVATLQKKH